MEIFAVPRSRLAIHDLGLEELSALFERMAHHYAFNVVDLPVAPHAWTIPLPTASEGILVTGVNTIPGLRQIAETLRAVRAEGMTSAESGAVVNRCESSLFGGLVRTDHVARLLGEEKRFYVRQSGVAVECVNKGESIHAFPALGPDGQGHRGDRRLLPVAEARLGPPGVAMDARFAGMTGVDVYPRESGGPARRSLERSLRRLWMPRFRGHDRAACNRA